jgi:gliding motility-associated-like protein
MKFGFYITVFFLGLLLFAQKGNCQSITAGFLAGNITACQEVQSANEEIQYFKVGSRGLTGNLTASASDGFVISTSENTGFSDQIILTESNGEASATIYVRSAPSSTVGNITGTVTLTSPGANETSITVTANILATPVADTEKNITVLNGTTIPDLNFEGTGNTYLWTSSNPNIGLASTGVDSLPTFRAITNLNVPVIDTITVTPVWAGMAYIRDLAMVRVINGVTYMLDTTLSVFGKNPFSEVLSADMTRLFVLNIGSKNFAVINTITNKGKAEFPLPAKTYDESAITTAADDSLLYVLNLGNMSIINATNGNLIQFVPVNAVYAAGFAVNPNGQEVYATGMENVNTGVLSFTGIPNGNIIKRVVFPPGPGKVILAPDTSALAVISSGNVVVISTATQQVTATLSNFVLPPVALVYSPDGNILYVLTGYLLQAYSTSSFALKWQIALYSGPNGLAVSPDGTTIYVTNAGPAAVTVVNTLTQTVITNTALYNTPTIDIHTVTPGGCYGNPITFTITVNPSPLPTITETGDLTAMNTTYGTPSSSQSFSVSGTILRAGVLITPPPGFQVSLDNTNFSPTVTAGTGGTLAFVPVYIRIAAATVVGSYSGHVVLTSPGAANVTLAVPVSTVTPADLTITADDQTKAYGAPMPELTLTYKGFKNNDGPANLVYPPVVSTTANRNSPPGTYPITVGGAFSANYNITYLPGILTIVPNVIIPNTFTPNGDGINDTWNIQKINDYPNCTVQIFDRYGALLFSSIAYSVPWDGTYKGRALPAGTYYYIINLNANVPLLSGFVLLLR